MQVEKGKALEAFRKLSELKLDQRTLERECMRTVCSECDTKTFFFMRSGVVDAFDAAVRDEFDIVIERKPGETLVLPRTVVQGKVAIKYQCGIPAFPDNRREDLLRAIDMIEDALSTAKHLIVISDFDPGSLTAGWRTLEFDPQVRAGPLIVQALKDQMCDIPGADELARVCRNQMVAHRPRRPLRSGRLCVWLRSRVRSRSPLVMFRPVEDECTARAAVSRSQS
jgi:hypothetical protein